MAFLRSVATGFLGAGIRENERIAKLNDRMIMARMDDLMSIDAERRKKNAQAQEIGRRAQEAVQFGVFDDVNKAIMVMSNPAYADKSYDELAQIGKSFKEVGTPNAAAAPSPNAPQGGMPAGMPSAAQPSAMPQGGGPAGAPSPAPQSTGGFQLPRIMGGSPAMQAAQGGGPGETRIRTGNFSRDIVMPDANTQFKQWMGRDITPENPQVPGRDPAKQYVFEAKNMDLKTVIEHAIRNPKNFGSTGAYQQAMKLYAKGDYAGAANLVQVRHEDSPGGHKILVAQWAQEIAKRDNFASTEDQQKATAAFIRWSERGDEAARNEMVGYMQPKPPKEGSYPTNNPGYNSITGIIVARNGGEFKRNDRGEIVDYTLGKNAEATQYEISRAQEIYRKFREAGHDISPGEAADRAYVERVESLPENERPKAGPAFSQAQFNRVKKKIEQDGNEPPAPKPRTGATQSAAQPAANPQSTPNPQDQTELDRLRALPLQQRNEELRRLQREDPAKFKRLETLDKQGK